MVVHWETSLKSLYVRTVWIDGRRHAILSKDDPVANTICPIVTSISRSSRGSSPESSTSSTSSQSTDLTLNANPLNLSKIKSNNQYKYEQQKIERKDYNKNNKTEEQIFQEKNPLSERVLQWLDLAGRENLNLGTIDNFELDEFKKYESDIIKYDSRKTSMTPDCNNNAKKYKKHSHKINKKYNNKYNEINISEDESCDGYNTYVFNAPMVSNDILNYAKKSLNNPEIRSDTIYTLKTPISSSLITFDNEHLSNKNKTEFVNHKQLNKSRRPQTTNIMNVRHKLYEENEEEGVKKQSNFIGKCFESQYLELVRKRISENTYNLRKTRRQLHIFIPSLPKLTICDSTASSILTVDD